jgi:hypothetical protein
MSQCAVCLCGSVRCVCLPTQVRGLPSLEPEHTASHTWGRGGLVVSTVQIQRTRRQWRHMQRRGVRACVRVCVCVPARACGAGLVVGPVARAGHDHAVRRVVRLRPDPPAGRRRRRRAGAGAAVAGGEGGGEAAGGDGGAGPPVRPRREHVPRKLARERGRDRLPRTCIWLIPNAKTSIPVASRVTLLPTAYVAATSCRARARGRSETAAAGRWRSACTWNMAEKSRRSCSSFSRTDARSGVPASRRSHSCAAVSVTDPTMSRVRCALAWIDEERSRSERENEHQPVPPMSTTLGRCTLEAGL